MILPKWNPGLQSSKETCALWSWCDNVWGQRNGFNSWLPGQMHRLHSCVWVAVEAGKKMQKISGKWKGEYVAGWLCLADVQPGVTLRLSRLSQWSSMEMHGAVSWNISHDLFLRVQSLNGSYELLPESMWLGPSSGCTETKVETRQGILGGSPTSWVCMATSKRDSRSTGNIWEWNQVL